MSSERFYASGKLLLFGEYLVLRGSKCLSVPLAAGQFLSISPGESNEIIWECFEGDHKWLEITFSNAFEIVSTSAQEKALIVQKLLKLIAAKNTDLQITGKYFRFEINFHRNYGFGTSSTFISLLSQWSGADPYFLLQESFGGSGFDVATATAQTPVIYELNEHRVTTVEVSAAIQEKLLFIYLGNKQHSGREVSLFSKIKTTSTDKLMMNRIVEKAVGCDYIDEMDALMDESELLLSAILQTEPVKNTYFEDYAYSIKSLGAWGGDFIMATYRDENTAREYFTNKGCNPIFNYKQLIKS